MKLNNLNRTTKRIILMCIDAILLLLALQLSNGFIHFFANVSTEKFIITYILLIFIYFCTAWKLKIFSIINRFTDYRVLFNLTISITVAYLFILFSTFFYSSFSYRFTRGAS